MAKLKMKVLFQMLRNVQMLMRTEIVPCIAFTVHANK